MMYGYGEHEGRGFRGEETRRNEQEKKEKKILLAGIFLLITAMLGFGAGVFLYNRPAGSSEELLQRLYSGILCGFFKEGVTFSAAAESYLWIVCPLLLLLLSVFGSLTLPYSLALIAVKGFFSGYTCAALLDLQPPGAGGILCFLLFLLTEGVILLLTLSFAREGLLFREETRGMTLGSISKQPLQKKLKTLFLDLLFLCGVLLLLFLLRGVLCSFL